MHPAPGRSAAVGVAVENVSLSFGAMQVLTDVNLAIEPGEFFALLGPSGCGKTTLLRLLAGFERANSGRVLIGGKDVSALPPWRRNVGMVFQSYALWPHMTVRRNVAFGLEERKIPRQQLADRVQRALDLVGLGALGERRPSQLSGGQQQRVALARTIVIEPDVLLLDEPLSNLDAKLRVQMRHELLTLQRTLSITTIFVTHDQEEANTTADRIAVVDRGVIQQVGTPIELYDRPANLFVANFLGVANVIPGSVSESGGRMMFRSREGDLVVPLPNGHRDIRSVVFRPQDIALMAADAASPPDKIRLSGVVSHREFLGGVVRYHVDAGTRAFVVEEPHRRNHVAVPPGAPVSLVLDPAHAVGVRD
ncbi:MAG: ABC transporter ATP-binding protein [Rhodospirillales bacterium]|nr:ABC transporter ATP-binding protein [Rhodospirillales bacterium]